MIKKKMVQVGNSWGMVIPKAIIDGLQINPTTDTLEVYIADNEIRIRKRCDPRRHSGYERSRNMRTLSAHSIKFFDPA